MKTILLIICLLTSNLSAGIFPYPDIFNLSQRIYIDSQELDVDGLSDSFVIHIGGNEWVETSNLYRDETGLYTLCCQIKPSVINQCAYEKKWKCPYCYNLYPIGQACTKADCPSKYKDK